MPAPILTVYLNVFNIYGNDTKLYFFFRHLPDNNLEWQVMMLPWQPILQAGFSEIGRFLFLIFES